MRTLPLAFLALVLGTANAFAQQAPTPARADAAIHDAFLNAPADWQPRLTPDETMRECAVHRNKPPKDVVEAIEKRERATIVYPADNVLIGDWKKGEALAQSGYGLRFTDYPPRNANGGNCYACHQLTRAEVSYGTLGPSLLEYGKARNFRDAEVKAVYDRVYNSQAAYACSNMPRFGANKILTVEQIKDAVALLMSPDSPVNQGK
jgi:sulfur-oxidizing protein SoxX